MTSKRILIIGFVWPEPKSSAAGSRMMQLIETFKSANYNIIFASACARTNRAFNLETIGVAQETIVLNHSSFDEFVKALNPDVVLFDRFMAEEQFGWRVAAQCPNALRVLDTEDLHGLRKGRQKAFMDHASFNKAYMFNDIVKREIASIYRSDLSFIISEAEMNILKREFKVDESLLCYVPFMLEDVSQNKMKTLPKFEERQHFIAIGNFLHEPNYNATLYLKETIWPKIKRELPHAELHVYGAYASQKVNQLHNENQGFIVKGFVEDVNQVMRQAKVCLAPLRFGAGLKGKLVDAMQNGTPCMMTSIAAEGMFGDFKPNGFIEDNPEAFVSSAVELYTEAQLWEKMQQNGFKVINERFAKAKHQQEVMQTVTEAMEHINIKRQNNFIGQLLQHHTLQSTKYMGKWIEEKNKQQY